MSTSYGGEQDSLQKNLADSEPTVTAGHATGIVAKVRYVPLVGGVDQLIDSTSCNQRVENVGEIAHGLRVIHLCLLLHLQSFSPLHVASEGHRATPGLATW